MKRSWFDLFSWPRKPLLIADLANNHNGSVGFAKELIEELSDIQQKYQFPLAVKFQYRDLETFIHQKYKGSVEYAYIKRFESTKLEWKEFEVITKYAKSLGLITGATPFDELSVERVIEHGHDYLKIASASANDWPLLEKVTEKTCPIMISTGGLDELNLQRCVAKLSHADVDFAIMHCVSLYPTPDSQLNLHKIYELSSKFKRPIGYSTHESPQNKMAGALAVASGAMLLERHYGRSSDTAKLNQYSSSYSDFENWINGLQVAWEMLFDKDFEKSLNAQQAVLRQLKRGIWAKTQIAPGEKAMVDRLTFAIPVLENGFTTDDFSIRNEIEVNKMIEQNEALSSQNCTLKRIDSQIEEIRLEVRNQLTEAGISIPLDTRMVISHHYGLNNFSRYGACLITLINREYCKKLVILQPNQKHPEHMHLIKEESFIVLSGMAEVTLGDKCHNLSPGAVLVVERGVKHSLFSKEGAVIEEISTSHIAGDSYYTDSKISGESERKTETSFWNH